MHYRNEFSVVKSTQKSYLRKSKDGVLKYYFVGLFQLSHYIHIPNKNIAVLIEAISPSLRLSTKNDRR